MTMAALVAAAGIAGLKWSRHYFPDDRKAESWLWVAEPFNLKHFSSHLNEPWDRLIALLYECVARKNGVRALAKVRHSNMWGDGAVAIRVRVVQILLIAQSY